MISELHWWQEGQREYASLHITGQASAIPREVHALVLIRERHPTLLISNYHVSVTHWSIVKSEESDQ